MTSVEMSPVLEASHHMHSLTSSTVLNSNQNIFWHYRLFSNLKLISFYINAFLFFMIIYTFEKFLIKSPCLTVHTLNKILSERRVKINILSYLKEDIKMLN